MQDVFIYPQATAPALDRERLIKAHLSLADFLVERMACQVPSYMTRDDMHSAAMVGLFEAANRFDPGKGILFKTFAERRIRGAILDEARRMGWFSRSLRDKQSSIADTIDDLENRLGRPPEEPEVAQALGLGLEEYRELLAEVGQLGLVSLQETLDGSGEGRTLLETLEDEGAKNPEQRLQERELTRELAALLKKLTEKEQLVISLYYYEELSQKEIAEVLELSEGRVSQLHSQALIKLKGKLGRRGGAALSGGRSHGR
ncbi:DNA-directed RNA polymerase sigma-70 factor [Desulfuromonas versatilis]|uniref:DNA-directed RNA polymerase sigma-70 factor n=1 Tax=Desulfuromonas versatilis TaxID=2802975 RepID=A0ABN6E2N9_9BACT|nr:FliA/WhiG family RNA polymerase sigma factor [Desulfuromonas versatilis]BCR06615.1 DNA-directed RNA polymerase sigma-70 factor [Desulfuromonas versatilis]